MSSTGIILLAAGASTRLGQAKQLLPWHGTTLIRHLADVAVAAETGPVVVVLGSSAKACEESLAGLPVRVTVNDRWEEGMGTSIAAGMKCMLREDGYVRAVIVMLCDQPCVSVAILRALMNEQHKTGADTVASRYGGRMGAPALFTEEVFPLLFGLEGNQGARALLNDGQLQTCIDFPDGSRDIDTREDYEEWKGCSSVTY